MIYVVDISFDLKETLRKLQEQFAEGEEVVSTTSAGNQLVVVTKEQKGKKIKNLLLEEVRGRTNKT